EVRLLGMVRSALPSGKTAKGKADFPSLRPVAATITSRQRRLLPASSDGCAFWRRHRARERLFHLRERIRLVTNPDLRITGAKRVLLVTCCKDERDVAGQKQVRDRIGHHAA